MNNSIQLSVMERSLMFHLRSELEEKHGLFQQMLNDRYPKLTAYDIRLCIYLKCNLSTKEIAVLLNITPDSVKKAKHRLRRKLSLRPEQSIVRVLSS